MNRELLAAIVVGFAIGVAVGITLESSGVLERADAAVLKLAERRLAVVQDQEHDDVSSSSS